MWPTPIIIKQSATVALWGGGGCQFSQRSEHLEIPASLSRLSNSSGLQVQPRLKSSRRSQHERAPFHAFASLSTDAQPPTVKATETGTGSTKSGSTSSKSITRRVVVLGGSGRVGGSTAAALVRESAVSASDEEALKLEVYIAGRRRDKGEQAAASLDGIKGFIPCDIDDYANLLQVVADADLVIHCAGPFQRKTSCAVLEACIETKTAYMDVCDDVQYALMARGYHEAAKEAGIPAITTTGIYPGVSNVMAAELVRMAREAGGPQAAERLRFSYFTAGSGGAGPTILATSYLLLGEEVTAYREGERVQAKPYSGQAIVDFGKGVGRRSVYLLNLPEVVSTHRVLEVPTVSARFGTAPDIWNWAMQAVAALAPPGFLQDREKVQSLVDLSDPMVRAVDGLVGELMSIRVDLECADGVRAAGVLTHQRLSQCVGTATAAFAMAVLEGSTQPGVWFPEELGALSVEARQKLLERAKKGTSNYVFNRPPWMLETTPKWLGFGLYW